MAFWQSILLVVPRDFTLNLVMLGSLDNFSEIHAEIYAME